MGDRSTAQREWRIRNREKFLAQQQRANANNADYRHDWQLRKRYGISLADYERLLVEQNGCCAICGADQPGGRFRRFHVDHAHDTGEVRGLLCFRCNTNLAVLENAVWRDAADAYLRRAADALCCTGSVDL